MEKQPLLSWLAGIALLLHQPTTIAGDQSIVRLMARFETEANFDDKAGGKANADDPAIWAHPDRSAESFVIGTLKEGGLTVFDLHGKTLQRVATPIAPNPGDKPGRFNNVDILPQFELNGRIVDLAIVTDRGSDKLRIYRINPGYKHRGTQPLTDITSPHVPWVFSQSQHEVNQQQTAYGLATGWLQGQPIAIASQRNQSRLAKLVLIALPDDTVSYRLHERILLPGRFTLPDHHTWSPCLGNDGESAQIEGMVLDSQQGMLYAAQETVGIWGIPLKHVGKPTLLDKVKTFGVPYDRIWDTEEEEYNCTYRLDQDRGFGGHHLAADVEGLTLLRQQHDDDTYLLASSQGDSSFMAYRIKDSGNLKAKGRFTITDGHRSDSVQRCDGAAVSTAALGLDFPDGLLVVHDGDNTPVVLNDKGKPRENTNFKLLPIQQLTDALNLD
ncbi:phytase [Chitinivorax sp. B]|uniref:phytase n=1 Tax=Chitinivorax sp. B TaxID=2502235 RepID=UPI0010F972D8|nr:phytase [Chitinivorax sp. B]